MISAEDPDPCVIQGDARRCHGALEYAQHLPAVPSLEPLPAADAPPRQLLGDLAESQASGP
jgi:hypothetical protein